MVGKGNSTLTLLYNRYEEGETRATTAVVAAAMMKCSRRFVDIDDTKQIGLEIIPYQIELSSFFVD